MATDVIMPALGMAQETGTLLRWLRAEGDAVEKGDALMEIATDKVDVTIDAPAAGILSDVRAAEGDEIPVGETVARIVGPDEVPDTPTPSRALAPAVAPDDDKESASRSDPAASPVALRMAAEHSVDLDQIAPAGSRIQKADVEAYLAEQTRGHGSADNPEMDPRLQPPGKRMLASPKARRLAHEAGLNLCDLSGSGPQGAVLALDVERAQIDGSTVAEESIHQPWESPSRMWQIMAERLGQSWQSVPHFYLVREVDASALVSWRSNLTERLQEEPTYTDLLVLLTARTLRRHPRLNGGWQDGRLMLNEAVNVGLAVAVDAGLIVPVLQHADRLGIAEVAAGRSELMLRARNGDLTADDLQGGTFTLSNLGMFRVDAFSAIVNPPQAAILAVGRIVERVVPVDGVPAVRPMLTLTLSCDHRAVDGATAARFLTELADLAADPLRLLD